MMVSAKFAWATTLLCAVFVAADAIKCHSCSSFTDPRCADVSASDNGTLEECPPEGFCRKTFQEVAEQNITRVTRTCGRIKFEKHSGDYCMVSNTNFKKEVSCQCFTDGCNAGGRPGAAGVLFLSIGFVMVALSGC